jgi:hypothetical protein
MGHEAPGKELLGSARRRQRSIMRKHVVITGTGRCGTTFLVQLLTKLGLDTGFTLDQLERNNESHAGLERDIRREGCPFVVKSPWFCDYAEEVFARQDILVERVFVPIRDLHAAAESRRRVTSSRLAELPMLERLKHTLRPKRFAGGLWHTREPHRQEEVLLRQLYKLMLAVSDTEIPLTFMRYPRIVKDCPYLFEKLSPILPGITPDAFRQVFDSTVRVELIHTYGDRDR